MAYGEATPIPGMMHNPPITQWRVELIVTEGMPYTEEIRKHIVADRLMTAIPNANVRLRVIENMTEERNHE